MAKRTLKQMVKRGWTVDSVVAAVLLLLAGGGFASSPAGVVVAVLPLLGGLWFLVGLGDNRYAAGASSGYDHGFAAGVESQRRGRPD